MDLLISKYSLSMGKPLENLTSEALQLEPQDRVELAERLLASVFPDKEVEEAWAAEIERRIAEIESGRAKLLSRAEVISRVRATLK
jgi:putative addiction module component (TIGR02574 family)